MIVQSNRINRTHDNKLYTLIVAMSQPLALDSVVLGLYDDDDVRNKLSVVQVTDPTTNKQGVPGSLYDLRLGVTEPGTACPVCRNPKCVGHTGHIELERPVWRIPFVPTAAAVHGCVCEACGRPRVWPTHHGSRLVSKLLKRQKRSRSSTLRVLRDWGELCRGVTACPWTRDFVDAATRAIDMWDDLVTAETAAEIKAWLRSDHARRECGAPLFQYVSVHDVAVERVVKLDDLSLTEPRAALETLHEEPLTPEDSRQTFEKIPDCVAKLLGFDPRYTKPLHLVTSVQIVPSVKIRPSIMYANKSARSDDNMTYFLREILKQNIELQKAVALHEKAHFDAINTPSMQTVLKLMARLQSAASDDEFVPGMTVERARAVTSNEYNVLFREALAKTQPLRHAAWVQWQMLMCRVSDIVVPKHGEKYIQTHHLDTSLAAQRRLKLGKSSSDKLNTLQSRLVGKKGRVRGNMTGKRVNHCARSTIDPSPPDMDMWELGIPKDIMVVLTFPERVTDLSKARLAESVVLGHSVWHGATMVERPDPALGRDKRFALALMSYDDRLKCAAQLQIGDIVHRHLRDGDWVQFNRQPSLHAGSWQAFRARVAAYSKSFLLHSSVMGPFNADCDGDEMNLHSPQSVLVQAECATIMAAPYNIRADGTGRPRAGLIMGDVIMAFAMTQPGFCVTSAQFSQMLAHCRYGLRSILRGDPDEDPGARSRETQDSRIFAAVNDASSLVTLCLKMGASTGSVQGNLAFAALLLPKDLCVAPWIHGGIFKPSVALTKKLLTQIVDTLWQDYGPWTAGKFLSDAHRVLSILTLDHGGASIGLSDCLSAAAFKDTDAIVRASEHHVDEILTHPSLDDATKDAYVSEFLCKVRPYVEAKIMTHVNPSTNGLALVVLSGAKGSPVNIGQLMGCVGQQMFNGVRLKTVTLFDPVSRTYKQFGLPLFAPNETVPRSRGFVSSSFTKGLSFPELFAHLAATRISLTDTGVKTSQVGYNYRRMATFQMANFVAIDGSVRVPTGSIIEFQYGGGDQLDPRCVEQWRLLPFGKTVTKVQEAALAFLKIAGSPSQQWTVPRDWNRLATVFRTTAVFSDTDTDTEYTMDDYFAWLGMLLTEMDPLHASWPLRTRDDIVRMFETGTSETFGLLVARAAMALTVTWDIFCKLDLDGFAKAVVRACNVSRVGYGMPVGLIGASALSEPLQQMALNTFHSAGSSQTAVVSGVPRMQQLVNVYKTLASTAVHTCVLAPGLDACENVAVDLAQSLPQKLLRNFISRESYVRTPPTDREWDLLDATNTASPFGFSGLLKSQVAGYKKAIETAVGGRFSELSPVCAELVLKHEDLLRARMLPIDLQCALSSICVKEMLAVVSYDIVDGGETWLLRIRPRFTALLLTKIQLVMSKSFALADYEEMVCRRFASFLLDNVVVAGMRNVFSAEATKTREGSWSVRTYGPVSLSSLLQQIPILDRRRSFTTDVTAIEKMLGVEATYKQMIAELHDVYAESSVDPRHIRHLADNMLSSGMLLGLARFHMDLFGANILARAAFERTLAVFAEGAVSSARNEIICIPSSSVTGQIPKKFGTGAVEILQDKVDSHLDHLEVVKPLRLDSVEDLSHNHVYVAPLRAAADAAEAVHGGTDADVNEDVDDVREFAIPKRPDAFRTGFVPSQYLDQWPFDTSKAKSVLGDLESFQSKALPVVYEFEALWKLSMSKAEYDRCLRKLYQFRAWDAVDLGDVLMYDVFYKSSTHKTVRTTVSFADATWGRRILERVHITKHTVKAVQMGSWKVRLAAETDVPVSSLPPAVETLIVRIKSRRSFRLGDWRVDLTQVASGKNLIVAEKAPVKYELEIECVDVVSAIRSETFALGILRWMSDMYYVMQNE